jgi:hypothetical protein
VARAGVCDCDDNRGLVIEACTVAVKGCTITILEAHLLALDLLALPVDGGSGGRQAGARAISKGVKRYAPVVHMCVHKGATAAPCMTLLERNFRWSRCCKSARVCAELIAKHKMTIHQR